MRYLSEERRQSLHTERVSVSSTGTKTDFAFFSRSAGCSAGPGLIFEHYAVFRVDSGWPNFLGGSISTGLGISQSRGALNAPLILLWLSSCLMRG